jgi:hypothetical protein
MRLYCLTLAVLTYLPTARANPITPGNSGTPDVFTGQSTGTLLATLASPFSIANTQGTLVSAVYLEAGGTLDFYYQINVTTATDYINFNNDYGFTGSTTDVGYRTDGASLGGGEFVNGVNIPNSVFRATDRVAFGFPFDASPANQSSTVLEIQTNAVSFTSAIALVSNSTVQSSNLATFGAVAAPEPVSMVLAGAGLLAIAQFRRLRNRR